MREMRMREWWCGRCGFDFAVENRLRVGGENAMRSDREVLQMLLLSTTSVTRQVTLDQLVAYIVQTSIGGRPLIYHR